MATKELRIGNYIHIPGSFQKANVIGIVESISKEEVKTDKCEAYYFFFDPIELTEEWFLKLGFVTRYFNEDKNKPLWWKVESNRHIDIYFEKQVSANVFMINSLQYSVPILYVHQLQNLYFALTGKELKIKQ